MKKVTNISGAVEIFSTRRDQTMRVFCCVHVRMAASVRVCVYR